MNTNEEWSPVVGYEGFYAVSSEGRIKSIVRRSRNGRIIGGKVLRIADNGHGYKSVMFCVNYKKARRYVHRIVLEAFVGPCPEGMESRHMNGIRGDNRASNLQWSTHIDNVWDRDRHGTMVHGEENNFSRLSRSQVKEIREKYASGLYRQHDLAGQYGITQTGIGYIVRGTVWSRAGGPITKVGLGKYPRKLAAEATA